MTSVDDRFDKLTSALRQHAALSGPFNPVAALKDLGGKQVADDPLLMVEVLSAVEADCTVEKRDDGDLWVMRPGARRKLLDSGSGGAPDDAAAEHAPSDIEQALQGAGAFAPDRVAALIAQGDDMEAMGAAAVTLERAGPRAPGYAHLVALRSALNRGGMIRRADELFSKGFFGREQELATLSEWIAAPQGSRPLMTVHISGLPGAGKSFLLHRAIQQARLKQDPVLVHLDFDRSALRVEQVRSLVEEISRQVADSLPNAASALRRVRLASAEEGAVLDKAGNRQHLPRQLLSEVGRVMRESGRSMLIVLDTLEVLRSRGRTFVETLFDRLDLLLDFGVPAISVISAGRGDAIDPDSARLAGRVDLPGLEPPEAERLLRGQGVDPRHWARAIELAGGNPLLLRLAGAASQTEALEVGEDWDRISDKMKVDYLYRAILSRVPAHLAEVAHYGLLLRRLDADALIGVVWPALGLDPAGRSPDALIDELALQEWLVRPDRDGGLRQRSDARAAFLPLIYGDNPERAAAIDRRAAKWFEGRSDLDVLYHRLQLTRIGVPLPEVPPRLAAAFDAPTLVDLPIEARQAVLVAQGQRVSDRADAAPERVAQVAPEPQPETQPAPAWRPVAKMEAESVPSQFSFSAAQDQGFIDRVLTSALDRVLKMPATQAVLSRALGQFLGQVQGPSSGQGQLLGSLLGGSQDTAVVAKALAPAPERPVMPKVAVSLPARVKGLAAASDQPPPGEPDPTAPRLYIQFDSDRGRIKVFHAPDGMGSNPDPGRLHDLRLMLEAGELREAEHVLQHGFTHPFTVGSPAGLLVMAWYWRTGRWSFVRNAQRSLGPSSLLSCLEVDPHFLGRILLEIWAEFRFSALSVRLANPAFRKQVAEVLTLSESAGPTGAALDLAVLAASPADAATAGKGQGRFVGGITAGIVGHCLQPPPEESMFDARTQARAVRAAMGLSLPAGGKAPESMDQAALAVAPLNPYAGPVLARLRAFEDEAEAKGRPAAGRRVLSHLEDLGADLEHGARIFASSIGGCDRLAARLSANRSDVADALGAVGLTAEWVVGYAFHASAADLAVLGRSAERWRRCVNGDWCLDGPAPDTWVHPTKPGGDSGSASLMTRLSASTAPVAAATEALLYWQPTRAEQAGKTTSRDAPKWISKRARMRLSGRYGRALAQAGQDGGDSMMHTLDLLQRSGVPGILAAPLAVLAHEGVPPETVFAQESGTSS